METIKFAPLIRVSTEQQEQKGESLYTQKEQIENYVSQLGGVVPDICWSYSGQEHATPNQERVKLDKLLQDAGKDLFDAVIVCDVSRWSRDNKKSKEGLEVLRKNNIRFFVGGMEYNLFDPTTILLLGMSAEIGEFQARQQALKSIQNRIARAKKGLPTAGKLPYGRTYTAEHGWGIDEDKKLIIEQAAKRYLEREQLPKIAESYSMNHSNLWKILTRRCGDRWEQKFENKKVNISETVTITIPRLLDQKTIDDIKLRATANKTYTHGQKIHDYLLARMIFHEKCGYTMFGYINSSGTKYYRRQYRNGCTLDKMLRADMIDDIVLLHLASTFGNREKMKKAINDATPSLEKLTSLEKEKAQLEKQILKADKERQNLISKVAKGLIEDSDIEIQITSIREREIASKDRIAVIDSIIAEIPDPAVIKKQINNLANKVGLQLSKDEPDWILKKDFKWKRAFVEQAFAGKNAEGRRYGVYVEHLGDNNWKYYLRGAFGEHLLDMTDKETITKYAMYLQGIALRLFHFPLNTHLQHA